MKSFKYWGEVAASAARGASCKIHLNVFHLIIRPNLIYSVTQQPFANMANRTLHYRPSDPQYLQLHEVPASKTTLILSGRCALKESVPLTEPVQKPCLQLRHKAARG